MKQAAQHQLRFGFTTGTCATAVAKAAVTMLVHQHIVDCTEVRLPDGSVHLMEIIRQRLNAAEATCSVIKDAGDDPDITHGAELCGKARFIAENTVRITGGPGVGTVTKPGLAVAPGKAAINPVPMRMIREAIEALKPVDKGIEVEISIPRGEELAQRTFNPRLGIEGGLSILGTSGIVKPMSEEALKASLVIKLQQLRALGRTKALYAPGNYGTDFARHHLPANADDVVLTSNYIGYMLEVGVTEGFKHIVLVGHPGKLVKVAGGIFQTHSRVADARNEILAAHHFQYSGDAALFCRLMTVNTTEEAIELLPDPAFWNHLATRIKERCEHYVYGDMQVDVVLFSQQKGLIGHSPKALETIQDIYHND